MNTNGTQAEVCSSEGLGLEPERAKYCARGLGWALANALTSPAENWTAQDVANAYADGALETVAAERERCARLVEAGIDPQCHETEDEALRQAAARIRGA